MSASYNDQTAWLLQSNCIDSSARPSLDTMYITVFAPTGAFVCPRSHNLGIGLRFHGCSAPSNTYHTPRLGFKFRDWFGVSWSHCTWEHILHATFRVLNFRDWFGVSCLYCTLQSTLETTFRVLNFRDWFGVSFLYCTLKSTLETTFSVFIHLGRLPSLFRSRGKRRSLAVNVGKYTINGSYRLWRREMRIRHVGFLVVQIVL